MPRKYEKSLISSHHEFLKFLKNVKPSFRKKIITQCRKEEIDCLSEIFSNFLKKNLTTKNKVVNKLRPHKSLIRQVALKKTPVREKKNILSSTAGGSILSILLPLATSLLGSLMK